MVVIIAKHMTYFVGLSKGVVEIEEEDGTEETSQPYGQHFCCCWWWVVTRRRVGDWQSSLLKKKKYFTLESDSTGFSISLGQFRYGTQGACSVLHSFVVKEFSFMTKIYCLTQVPKAASEYQQLCVQSKPENWTLNWIGSLIYIQFVLFFHCWFLETFVVQNHKYFWLVNWP